MSILLVTGIEGARNCAAALETQLSVEVEVADGRKSALVELRGKEYLTVVIDQTLADCDPAGAERIFEQAGLAIPLQINFAISGAARLAREIRAALQRREREQSVVRRATAAAMEAELKSTVAGLVLNSQLALNNCAVPGPTADRLRTVAGLVESLRRQLNVSLDPRIHAAQPVENKPGRQSAHKCVESQTQSQAAICAA